MQADILLKANVHLACRHPARVEYQLLFVHTWVQPFFFQRGCSQNTEAVRCGPVLPAHAANLV